MIAMRNIGPLPEAFATLRQAAEQEGFAFLGRLESHWNGARYQDDDLATVWAAFEQDALIAVGAQTFDEYLPSPLHRRIRHFYVTPGQRRSGIGRALAAKLIADAFAVAPRLHLRATHATSLKFWDAVGFARADHPSRTHELVRPGL